MIVPEEFEFRIITEHEDRLTICQSHCGLLLSASSAQPNAFRQNCNNSITGSDRPKFWFVCGPGRAMVSTKAMKEKTT